LFDEDKVLRLDKEYSFDVTVLDGTNRYNGKLELSPSACSLHVSAERHASVDFYSPTQIECSAFDKTFTLFGLSMTYSSSKALSMSPDNQVGFYEYKFDIGFLICSEGHFNFAGNVTSLFIDAPMLRKWVGHTNKQQDILIKHAQRTLKPFDENSLEFIHPIGGYGSVLMSYSIMTFGSALSFSAGLEFPPKLGVQFENSIPLGDVNQEFNKIYNLMTLFIGSDFAINTVQLYTDDSVYSSDISIYFTCNHKTHEVDYPVIPLGRDLWHRDMPLPITPLECFSEYYNLSDDNRSVYDKYLRYKRMKSDEERFLGYFRLLEKLTYKSKCYVDSFLLSELLGKSNKYIKGRLKSNSKDTSSFLNRVKHANGSKYNTEKCIGDFFDALPDDLLKSIKYKKSDLRKICDLRNDITHANDYSISEEDLSCYTAFVNTLLYLALLNQIGIIPKEGALAVHRLSGFHHIQNHNS